MNKLLFSFPFVSCDSSQQSCSRQPEKIAHSQPFLTALIGQHNQLLLPFHTVHTQQSPSIRHVNIKLVCFIVSVLSLVYSYITLSNFVVTINTPFNAFPFSTLIKTFLVRTSIFQSISQPIYSYLLLLLPKASNLLVILTEPLSLK